MKRFICCLAFSFFVVAAFSQKVYFVYLQSDMEQPFYVRMNEKIFSAAPAGYLILSKLKDSTYTIKLGFPQNKWPDQSFKIEIAGKDRGYQLRNFGEKGWGLIDLQTLSIQMSVGVSDNKTSQAEPYEVSPFTAVLSLASNDPSLRERPARKEEPQAMQAVSKAEVPPVNNKEQAKTDLTIKKEQPPIAFKEENVGIYQEEANKTNPAVGKEKETQPGQVANKPDSAIKTESIPGIINEDKPVTAKEEKVMVIPAREDSAALVNADTTEKKEPVIAVEEYKASRVRKKSESSTTEGFGLTFIDEYGDGKKDTVKIIIPNPEKQRAVVKEQPKSNETEPVKEERQFLDISTDTKQMTDGSKAADEQAKKSQLIICTAVASENDFLKLRKKMAGANTDEGMVNEAVKYFKSKCFSVMQVKNLSTLFLNDEKKYKFFQAAYSHVSDPAGFGSLQTELKEEKYVSQFNALLQ